MASLVQRLSRSAKFASTSSRAFTHTFNDYRRMVNEREEAAKKLTLRDITPTPMAAEMPCKENNWSYPKLIPADLSHRIMSLVDECGRPINHGQVLNHFTTHPTNPVREKFVRYVLARLLKFRHVKRVVRNVALGKPKALFYVTSNKSKKHFQQKLTKIESKGLPITHSPELPLWKIRGPKAKKTTEAEPTPASA